MVLGRPVYHNIFSQDYLRVLFEDFANCKLEVRNLPATADPVVLSFHGHHRNIYWGGKYLFDFMETLPMYGSQWFHRYRIDESATDNIRGKSMFFDDVIHKSPENCSTFTAAQSKEMEIFSNLNAMPSVVGGTLDVYKTIEDIKQNMYDTSDFPIKIEVEEYFESERRYLFTPEMVYIIF